MELSITCSLRVAWIGETDCPPVLVRGHGWSRLIPNRDWLVELPAYSKSMSDHLSAFHAPKKAGTFMHLKMLRLS